jgi:hypothetical protein
MVVPQSGQVPFVIGLPFFVVLSTGFCISFLVLHFTQYASMAILVASISLSDMCGCGLGPLLFAYDTPSISIIMVTVKFV